MSRYPGGRSLREQGARRAGNPVCGRLRVEVSEWETQ